MNIKVKSKRIFLFIIASGFVIFIISMMTFFVNQKLKSVNNRINSKDIEIQSLQEQVMALRDFQTNVYISQSQLPSPNPVGISRNEEYADIYKKNNLLEINCFKPNLENPDIPNEVRIKFPKSAIKLYCVNQNQAFIIIEEIKDQTSTEDCSLCKYYQKQVLFAVIDLENSTFLSKTEFSNHTINSYRLLSWSSNNKIYILNNEEDYKVNKYINNVIYIYSVNDNKINRASLCADSIGNLIPCKYCNSSDKNYFSDPKTNKCYLTCNYQSDCLAEFGEVCQAITIDKNNLLQSQLVCK